MSQESFICEWCRRVFNRNSNLKRHLNNSKIPCNLKCRQCGLQLASKLAYKDHAEFCKGEPPKKIARKKRTQHPESEEMTIVKRVPYESNSDVIKETIDTDKSPIPFEDFDVEFIQDVRIVGYERDGEPVTFLNDGSDGSPAEVGKLDNYNVKIQVYRGVRAKKTVTPGFMYRAMESLDREIPKEKLQYIATNMIHDVLCQDKDPRLHSVCMSDISRGTVRALKRVPNNVEKTYWATHPKVAGLDAVNDLARKLFSFFLEAGTQSVKAARWTLKDEECVGYSGANDWSIILYEDPVTGLEAKRAPNHQIDYDATRPPSDRLLQLIQVRKDEVFEKLKTLIIEHKDLEACLRQSRQFCYPTMKDNM